MEIIEEPIQGLKLIRPRVFEDQRGYFYESYNQQQMKAIGINETFVQDNQSLSQKDVVRGLHFQIPPMAQGKLVRVVKGAVLDVAVDIRKDSPDYGRVYAVELTESNKLMLWIPVGFAHGFRTLVDDTVFSYKCTNYYSKEHEQGIMWNDPDLAIDWKISDPILSEKDKMNSNFKDFKSPF